MTGQPRQAAGLLASFDGAEPLLGAVRELRARGYRCLDAYTPFPVEGLPQALGLRRSRMPLVMLAGGLVGGVGAYLLQWWTAVVDYPINVGGRPLHAWPAFIPVTFEMTILFAALAGVAALFLRCGLPRLHHPLFDIPDFTLATRNRFFLAIEAQDGCFDRHRTARTLRELGALRVMELPA